MKIIAIRLLCNVSTAFIVVFLSGKVLANEIVLKLVYSGNIYNTTFNQRYSMTMEVYMRKDNSMFTHIRAGNQIYRNIKVTQQDKSTYFLSGSSFQFGYPWEVKSICKATIEGELVTCDYSLNPLQFNSQPRQNGKLYGALTMVKRYNQKRSISGNRYCTNEPLPLLPGIRVAPSGRTVNGVVQAGVFPHYYYVPRCK